MKNVVDLFSGAGGMSYGFHAHPSFRLVGAADGEFGKPSSPAGSLQCNDTYRLNIGLAPTRTDLSAVAPERLREVLGLAPQTKVDVLCTCPPCTGFSRANPLNHLRDDPRNGLVRLSADFALALDADIVVMENARELVQGNFTEHYECLIESLRAGGYRVFGRAYLLSLFGLPQIRERAIIIAAKRKYELHTLDELWAGHRVVETALTVRRAFSVIDDEDPAQRLFPDFASQEVRERMLAMPRDGGSWLDLAKNSATRHLLTNAMLRNWRTGRIGSYPDVYGRMWWNRPAPTIKRECAHCGNGRYAHPVEDRLCSVREMATLQGFPQTFRFGASALSNLYRHIGDAVPPLISHQLAWVCDWMLGGCKPDVRQTMLANTHIRKDEDIEKDYAVLLENGASAGT